MLYHINRKQTKMGFKEEVPELEDKKSKFTLVIDGDGSHDAHDMARQQ